MFANNSFLYQYFNAVNIYNSEYNSLKVYMSKVLESALNVRHKKSFMHSIECQINDLEKWD